MPGKNMPQIKNEKQYEALLEKGYSKQKEDDYLFTISK